MAYDSAETSIDHIGGSDYCTFSASEQWSILLTNKMKREHPNEVEIIATNPDGSLVSHIPFKCMKYIRFPSKREMSEEEREALSNRCRKMRKIALDNKRANNSDNDGDDDNSDYDSEDEDEVDISNTNDNGNGISNTNDRILWILKIKIEQLKI